MAHYAFLDQNNIVVEVIVGKEENEDGINWEQWYADFRGMQCKRTSYNTKQGIHKTGGTPFRKNFAGIGYAYNAELDAFIPPKSFIGAVLDEQTCTWTTPFSWVDEDEKGNKISPVPKPDNTKEYGWDESTLSWFEIEGQY